MENTTNPPLFEVGQHVMVFYDTTWCPASILDIEIVFCVPPDEIYEYLIRWKWPGWADVVVQERDIMMIYGR
eukprot:11423819-Ditylum_brightwellii.AAC.1